LLSAQNKKMNKYPKHVNGVFTEIVGSDKEISKFELFLMASPEDTSPDLTKLTGTYKNIVTQWKSNFETVAVLEELILQMRSMENLSEIKLSKVRDEYIYARSPFFRRGGSTKDIRVIVGRTDINGEDLNVLAKDITFMELAKRKIKTAMNEVITQNKNIYSRISK